MRASVEIAVGLLDMLVEVVLLAEVLELEFAFWSCDSESES